MGRLPQAVRRVDRDLQAIGALTQAIVDGSDLEQLLARVASEARALVRAKVGVVVTVGGDPAELTFRAVDGLATGPLRVGLVMPASGTLTDLAVKTGSNIVARGAAELPPQGRAFAAATGSGPLIAAPLIAIGSARGVLVIAKPDGARPFRPADVELIETFAVQAASAIELFELRAAEGRLAVERERERIGRDLHDSVLAALTELATSVRSLATATTDPALTSSIDEAARQLDAASDAIRGYASELGSPGTDAPASPLVGDAPVPSAPAPRARPTRSGLPVDDTIATIGRLARASATDAPTEGALQALAHDLVLRVAARSALVGTLTDGPDHLLVKAHAGPVVPGREVGDLVPIGEALPAEAISPGGASALPGTAETPAAPVSAGRQGERLVVVPLAVRGARLGALVVGRPATAPAFSQAETRLIEAYGAHAAIALEFERVREELRLASVFAERNRIGRDLHERVIQLLFGIALALEALESKVRDPAVRRSLRAAVDGLDQAIRDLRRFVFDLGPRVALEGDGTGAAEAIEVLAADNARLHAEVEAQLQEVRASRARIVAAGDAERKRVERNLHDGAQQRLVSLTLALRMARAQLGDDLDPSARSSLEQASQEARAAIDELRELARGIHPQILAQAGLRAAIASLAARQSVDVLVDMTTDRFAPAIEGAAYFTVSEALANAAKYARATEIVVRGHWRDDTLTIVVSDDGVGGADARSGSGLSGLVDRLAAIDGTLQIASPAGGGTRLVARIPAPSGQPLPV